LRLLGGAHVEPLFGLVETQGTRVLLLTAAIEAFVLLVELLAVTLELVTLPDHLAALALGLFLGALQGLLYSVPFALEVLRQALALMPDVILPTPAVLLDLVLSGGLSELDGAFRFALGLGYPGGVKSLGLSMRVDLLTPA